MSLVCADLCSPSTHSLLLFSPLCPSSSIPSQISPSPFHVLADSAKLWCFRCTTSHPPTTSHPFSFSFGLFSYPNIPWSVSSILILNRGVPFPFRLPFVASFSAQHHSQLPVGGCGGFSQSVQQLPRPVTLPAHNGWLVGGLGGLCALPHKDTVSQVGR
ncbi:hypothetical protein GGR51DRAFT_340750 [Nemania sp. FL0031]|nr:hypothetical protein GGR51DRAFT_340750 [Nemania sp. FL0031]